VNETLKMGQLRIDLIDVVNELGVKWAKEGEEFTLSSGAKSKYYIDCRKVTLNPNGLHIVVDSLIEKLQQYNINSVGGPVIGADPIVGGLLYAGRHYRGFLVRKATKEHGMQNLIEGNLREGDKVAVVEDVVTSGGSVFKAIEAIENAGATVSVVVPILDRLAGASENFASRGYEFSPLITLDDLGIDGSSS